MLLWCTLFFFFFVFFSSSPLRYLVTPAVKNLLPVFDELSWKSLEKRPKFPHVNTEGGWQIWVLFFVSISISGFRLIFIELPLLYLPKHSYGKNVFWKIFSGVLNFCSLTCHGLMGGGGGVFAPSTSTLWKRQSILKTFTWLQNWHHVNQ